MRERRHEKGEKRRIKILSEFRVRSIFNDARESRIGVGNIELRIDDDFFVGIIRVDCFAVRINAPVVFFAARDCSGDVINLKIDDGRGRFALKKLNAALKASARPQNRARQSGEREPSSSDIKFNRIVRLLRRRRARIRRGRLW